MKRVSLTQYLVEQQREHGRIPAQLRLLIEVVARACKRIAIAVNKGALGDVLGSADSENVQGEVQKKLDIISNEVLIEANEWGGHLAAMASEEMDSIHVVPHRYPQGEYLLLFDPLDGQQHRRQRQHRHHLQRAAQGGPHARRERRGLPAARQAPGGGRLLRLRPADHAGADAGRRRGHVHAQPRDRLLGADQFGRADPEDTREFAINMSNMRHWAPPVTRYIDECLAGKDGPRGKDFNMRWVASMVADVHRILTRGGIFLYPWDQREPDKPGKLRLMYEANPMAFLVEQAGGTWPPTAASASWTSCRPALHERVSVVPGLAGTPERGAARHRLKAHHVVR
jgi:fructose-1,6-bisphosphatase I